jgi:hypothetical protein
MAPVKEFPCRLSHAYRQDRVWSTLASSPRTDVPAMPPMIDGHLFEFGLTQPVTVYGIRIVGSLAATLPCRSYAELAGFT